MPSELKKRTSANSSNKTGKVLPKDKGQPKDSKSAKDNKNSVEEKPLPGARFGPLPGISKHRLWSRSALILGLMTIVYFSSGKNEEVFADVKTLKAKSMETKCSPEITKSKCEAKKCGRLATDALMTGEEVFSLIDLCRRGFISHPGVSVMDLGNKVVKFDGMVKSLNGVFQKSDANVFQAVKSKLQRIVSAHFGIDYWKLHLAGPTFMYMMKPGGKDISQVTSHQKTLSYTYSTIVFLTDFEKDVKGGRLVFVDSDNTNRTVAPIQGRVLAFSSGDENSFFFEKVEKGISYALTVGFTCDEGIADPSF